MKNEVSAFPPDSVMRQGHSRPGGVFLSAAGVHIGGGLVLLEALVRGLASTLQDALIDERTQGSLALPPAARVTYLGRSPLARCLGLARLSTRVGPRDVLFCFNSLPPLVRPAGRVVTYVQAPYLVGRDPGVHYAGLSRAKHALERLWFRAGVRNCDEVWVQTPSMARAMLGEYPGLDVRVVPLIDDDLAAMLSDPEPARAAPEYGSYSFFYPADAQPHKNHVHLLKAWALLGSRGRQPRLFLTLRPPEMDEVLRLAELTAAQLPSVENLGRMPRAQVLDRMRESSALVFASRVETFGLPLLEARALRVPVLAAERDFVRDVCEPAQTFDPGSPVSIAAAVRRFVEGSVPAEHGYYTAAELVERLLTCSR
jgi:glycosyltransferase involved in cell wall biosynthesis